jgi:hypothetical protein
MELAASSVIIPIPAPPLPTSNIFITHISIKLQIISILQEHFSKATTSAQYNNHAM